jgi:hypothetical protein
MKTAVPPKISGSRWATGWFGFMAFPNLMRLTGYYMPFWPLTDSDNGSAFKPVGVLAGRSAPISNP